MMDTADKEFLSTLFEAAVEAADPFKTLRRHLPQPPKGRTIVIGAGKGAAQMASAFEQLWQGPLEGVVVTRYGYAAQTKHIRVLEAAHPVPDAAGLEATQALFAAVEDTTPDDLVVALICGGGSALLPAPPHGLAFEDEQELNRTLLSSGAPISAMNAIRKQFSRIKGGRLAQAAAPARVVSLVVSDVPGDDPAQVASGPTVADKSDRAAARQLIDFHQIQLSKKLSDFLSMAPEDSPHPDKLTGNEVHVIASASLSLEAAKLRAEAEGFSAAILSDSIEGEAQDIGAMHAAIAREVCTNSQPFERPIVILSGGETTVTLSGAEGGKGGRNTDFLLSFAKGIADHKVAAIAADTDGIDGSEDNAGAFADGSTWAGIAATGHSPEAFLAKHDAWSAFNTVGDLFVPGPTGTNVNDFRAILIR